MVNNKENGTIRIKQKTIFGDSSDIFQELIKKYPSIHELKYEREMTKDEIRHYLQINKEYELKRLGIERIYNENDIELTPTELMEEKIRIRKFDSYDNYIKEYAKASLNTAQIVPGAKPYQIFCGNKKIGILTLANVLLSTTPRNEIFPKELDKQDGYNLQVCVSYPWSGKYLVGKLLATLACTKAFVDNKDYLETTSLFGKSVQYDRLPFLHYLGLTSGGLGAKYLFPHQFYTDLRDKLRNFVNHWSLEGKTFHDRKQQRLIVLLKLTGLWDKGYRVGNLIMKRGYYICYLNNRFKDYEAKRLPPKSFSEAVEYWRNRWLVKRVADEKNL